MTSRDGIERIKLKNGEVRYRLRLIAYHPDTGNKFVDTQRVVKAAGRPEAKALKADMLAELVAQKLGELRTGERLRFAEAAKRWHETIDCYSTASTWGSYLKKLNEAFGARWLDSIEREDLQRFLSRLEYSRSMVKGIKAVMVNVFEWAIEHGHKVAKQSPIDGLVMPKRKLDRVAAMEELETSAPAKMGLDHAELARFMPALRAKYPDLYTLVLVQLALGCRFAEVSALKRSDIDLETGQLTIRRGQVSGRIGLTKNKRARAAALPRTALEQVRAHIALMDERGWPGHEEWLFPAKPHGLRRNGNLWVRSTAGGKIKEVMAAVGVETRTATHFARHTLNGLIRGHVADSVLFSVVGHADQKTNAIYGDARVLDFAAEVERVILKRSGGTVGGNHAEGEG